MTDLRTIAVITDVHANLPALEAALAAIAELGVEEIVHLGDAIGIGPFPSETLTRLLATPGMRCIMGNHDAWFVDGLPQPSWMSSGEVAHQLWVHAELERADSCLRMQVATWDWRITETIGGRCVRWQHYALDASGHDFAPIGHAPKGMDLDRLFGITDVPGERPVLIFYGHHHPQSDLVAPSGTRFVNPGALGCSPDALARFVLFHQRNDQRNDQRADQRARESELEVTHHAVPYDVEIVLHAFEQRKVPERALIRSAFFGR